MTCGSRLHRGLVLAALVVASGCAESVYLSSRPSGATVTINDQRVGRTPMVYSVVPAEWSPPYRYRVERPGFEPAEGVLETGVSDGRVVGGILSLGLSLFFKQPDTFLREDYLFELERTSTPVPHRGTPTRGPRTLRPVPQPPAVPYEPPAPAPGRLGEPPPRERLAPPPASPRPRPTPSPAAPRRAPTAAPTAKPVPKKPAPPPEPPPEPPVPAPITGEVPAEGTTTDVQKELERLRQLRDDGVIVDAEYEQLRDSLLKGQ